MPQRPLLQLFQQIFTRPRSEDGALRSLYHALDSPCCCPILGWGAGRPLSRAGAVWLTCVQGEEGDAEGSQVEGIGVLPYVHRVWRAIRNSQGKQLPLAIHEGLHRGAATLAARANVTTERQASQQTRSDARKQGSGGTPCTVARCVPPGSEVMPRWVADD